MVKNPICPIDLTEMLHPTDIGVDDAYCRTYFCPTCKFHYQEGSSDQEIKEQAREYVQKLEFQLNDLKTKTSQLVRILNQKNNPLKQETQGKSEKSTKPSFSSGYMGCSAGAIQ